MVSEHFLEELKKSILGFKSLTIATVTAVIYGGFLVLIVAKTVIKLSTEDSLNGDVGQHLTELVEGFICF